jgi:hypothetical protein
MLLSKKQTTEDWVVEFLAKNPYSTGPEIVYAINLARGHTVKQTVYNALSNLLEDEIVTKVKNTYIISKVWLNRVDKLLGIHSESELARESIFDLTEGESISYQFPSLISCDTYWEHLFNILIEHTAETTPIAVWNPHEWFGIAREPIERDIYESFTRHNRYAFFTTRGTSTIDHEFKKAWRTDHVGINCDNTINLKDTMYINVFDDFIIDVIFSQSLTEKIEGWYQMNTVITQQNREELIAIIHEKHPLRMKITRSQKKSAVLRKKLLRDFFVPEHLTRD